MPLERGEAGNAGESVELQPINQNGTHNQEEQDESQQTWQTWRLEQQRRAYLAWDHWTGPGSIYDRAWRQLKWDSFWGIHAEASDDDDDENQSLDIDSYLWSLLPDKGMYWFKAREDGLLLTYVILVWLDLIGIGLLFTVFMYSPDDIHPEDRKVCGLTEDWDWWRGTLIFLCSTFIANLGGPFFALFAANGMIISTLIHGVVLLFVVVLVPILINMHHWFWLYAFWPFLVAFWIYFVWQQGLHYKDEPRNQLIREAERKRIGDRLYLWNDRRRVGLFRSKLPFLKRYFCFGTCRRVQSA